MSGKNGGTPGGHRLRALREDRRRTQLDVELGANLGIGYLQWVESGKVRYPERDTLERILSALNAYYTERRDILELFGYVVANPLPTAGEIKTAVALSHAELADAVLPAYLLDCAHRLLAWNALVPRLFPAGPFAAHSQGHSVSMLRLVFDPAFHVTPLIANPEAFFPAQIRALRYQMRLFLAEDWSVDLINTLLDECPLFASYWTQAVDDTTDDIAGRPLIPLALDLPGTGQLRFRLTSEPFARDRRFRIIYYIPADAVTIQHCASWRQATGGVL